MAYYILKSYKLKIDPLRLCAVFKSQENSFFLDTSLNRDTFAASKVTPLSINPSVPLGIDYSRGRYSFLGINPFYILEAKNKDPFKKLRELLDEYRIERPPKQLPFLGGAVGYFSYDLGFILEGKIKIKPQETPEIADCFLGFYNAAVTVDHWKKIFYIAALGFPEKKHYLAKALAEHNFKKIAKLISQAAPFKEDKPRVIAPHPQALKSNFTKEGYLSAIKKAKEYIRRGDIYQVNLSQRFESKTHLESFEIYQRLRELSPSYFGAYFDAGNFQILSSSPERFLSLKGDRVVTRPMKGTRPRGTTKGEDASLKNELVNSAKDKAELVMIVDLERNDLGRVCRYNSVRVAALRELEKYNTVFQTTATVCGKLHKDKDRIDLLRACFPGGSITGCPKIRAMEIIDELEPTRRSIYTGSLGYLSFCGDMDFNLLIRTILKKGNQVYFGTGGGIVADSDPEAEYQETLVKAKAMIKAIR